MNRRAGAISLIVVFAGLLVGCSSNAGKSVTEATATASFTPMPIPRDSVTTPYAVPVQPSTPAARRAYASGLLCKDLKAAGASFADANGYWIKAGRPARMDANHNGIPCETVYPLSDIEPVYPQADAAAIPTSTPPTTTAGTDPRFGTCKEANAAGYGPYTQGVDPEYDWYIDRDHDGIDCER